MPQKIKWTLEKIKKGFESFYKKFSRYPTATEIDNWPELPTSRQIQRKFGGLPTLREKLKLHGPYDFTKGEYSSKRASMISKRSNLQEKVVYTYLVDKFGEPFVHREYLFNSDRRTRTDFYVFCDNNERFSVDVFYPNSIRNLTNCLNIKLKGYKELEISYPIIFLVMNNLIRQEEIEQLAGKRKNKLNLNQFIMTFTQFNDFCNSKKRVTL